MCWIFVEEREEREKRGGEREREREREVDRELMSPKYKCGEALTNSSLILRTLHVYLIFILYICILYMYMCVMISLSLYSILFYIFWIVEIVSSVLVLPMFMSDQKKNTHEIYHNDNYRENNQ